MVYEESVSLCSKGTPRGASASGESVGTGIDGHPSMSNTGGSTRVRKEDPESRSGELTNGKKEEEKKKSKRRPGSKLKVGMLTQSSRNLGDATEDTTRTHSHAREYSEYCPEREAAFLAAQEHSHQEYQLHFDQVKTRSANTNKSAARGIDKHQSRKGSG